MGAIIGSAITDCTENGTIDWTQESLTTELAQYPFFKLLFTYASVASIVVTVIFLEAAYFTATKVPSSAVANHRVNTVIMLSAFPVVILFCLPALLSPSSAPFSLVLVDLYWTFVMFKFVVLQVDYYGGHRKMMARLAAYRVVFHINVPVLCCFFCFKPVRLTRKSFIVIKILVLQVAIIRPILTFFQAIAGFSKLSLAGLPDLALQVISITSILVAVTGINMLTNASISKDLEKYELPAKFQLINFGMVIIGLQPPFIMLGNMFRPLGCILPFPDSMLTTQWQSFLLIVESTIAMIPILRYYRTADGNVVGVPPAIDDYDEDISSGLGKMRKWIRRHTLQ